MDVIENEIKPKNQTKIQTKEEKLEERKEKIEKIFDEDLSKNNREFEQSTETQINSLLYRVLAIVLVTIAIIFLKTLAPKSLSNNFFVVIFLLVIYGILVFSIVGLVYSVFIYFLRKLGDTLYLFLFEQNRKAVESLIFFSSLVFLNIFTSNGISKSLSEEAKSGSGQLKNFIITHIHSILLAGLCISICLLIKNFIVGSINYRIHLKLYKDRIEQNEVIVNYLQNLNTTLDEEIDPNLEKWSVKIFRHLSKGNDELFIDDFKKLFGVEDGENIFNLFDINHDGAVVEEEFQKRYVSLFRERVLLKRAIEKNSDGIQKLDYIITFCLLPVGIFLVFMSFNSIELFKNTFGLLGGVLLSLSFAFAQSISEVVTCIVFVYFVRPYDVGDMLEFDSKLYRVRSIGVLFTDLYQDVIPHSISNLVMRDKDIVNFRELQTRMFQIRKKYTYHSCYDKLDQLSKRIKNYLKKNPTMFTQRYFIHEFQIVNNVIEICFEFNVVCKYQEIRDSIKKRDHFAVFIYRVTTELGFEPRHHF